MNWYEVKIRESESKINELHALVYSTVKTRDRSAYERSVWSNACKDFHEAHSQLAFIGGELNYRERIVNGDPEAIEYGLCFLEVRPYFFRSGYMFKVIMKKLGAANLSTSQGERYQVVKDKWIKYVNEHRTRYR